MIKFQAYTVSKDDSCGEVHVGDDDVSSIRILAYETYVFKRIV